MARRGEERVPKAPAPLGGRGMKKGLTKATFSLEPAQLEVLRAEATRRMQERKAGRIDASEVVREAIEAWAKRRR